MITKVYLSRQKSTMKYNRHNVISLRYRRNLAKILPSFPPKFSDTFIEGRQLFRIIMRKEDNNLTTDDIPSHNYNHILYCIVSAANLLSR